MMQNGYQNNLISIFGNFALVLKEGLRGLRHVALSVRYFWAELFRSLPTAIRRPLLKLVGRFDNLADRVDRKTSLVAHQYLDLAIARDSDAATFSKIIVRDDAAMLFAKVTYDNLKHIVEYLSESLDINDKFFISEMLSACAYRKSVGSFSEFDHDRTKAGLLITNLMRQGVIRTHMSSNAIKSSNSDIVKLARVSFFANMLWLVIAKDFIPEREEDLLYACCDVSLVIVGQLEEAGENYEQLGELLKSHAEII